MKTSLFFSTFALSLLLLSSLIITLFSSSSQNGFVLAQNSTTTTTSMETATSNVLTTTSQTVSTSMTVPVSSTTTAPPPTTTTAAPEIPRVKLVVKLLNTTNITSAAQLQNFKEAFARALNISATLLTVSIGAESGTIDVVITAANASAIATEAINLPKSVLNSFGAAAVTEAPAASTTAAPLPEDKPLNIALIAGCAAGGIVILGILLYIAKKKGAEGDGENVTFQHSNDGTTFRNMENEMNTHRERKNYGTEQL